MYCFADAISSPPGGTRHVKLTVELTKGKVKGQSRSVSVNEGKNTKCGSLSCEEESLKMFPKLYN